MIDLEYVILQRAEEQCQSERVGGYKEPDSWDVLNAPEPARSRKRARCLAGDCDRPVRAGPYCALHAERIRATGMVDGPFGLEAWRKHGVDR